MPSVIIHDPASNLLIQQAVLPKVITATETSSVLDFVNGDGRCYLQVNVGAFSSTSATLQVQQSTVTNTGFTDVSGAVVTCTTSNEVKVLTFDRDFRYLRTVCTVSGTTGIGISAVIGEVYKTF